MIAALYVETGGIYYGLPGVEPWGKERNALLYDGPFPVVAHPPCPHWSIMGQCRGYEPRPEDYETFDHALECVRRFGGVLEHPAKTKAWKAFNLPKPAERGWTSLGPGQGWSCEVDQAHYGHRANKKTWLYFCGPRPPLVLKWGPAPKTGITVRNDGGGGRDQRSRTPEDFRDLLLSLADLSYVEEAA